jgi:hypothetical protein
MHAIRAALSFATVRLEVADPLGSWLNNLFITI